MNEDGISYPSSDFLDLREELEHLIPFFHWFVVRHVDYSKPCSCNMVSSDKITNTTICTRCFRFGYLFTDYLTKGYMWKGSLGFEFKTELGMISTQSNNFVARHNRVINKYDQILILDTERDTGVIRQPFKIQRLFLVQDTLPLYGKDGRVEFSKCTIEERNIDDYRSGTLGTSFSYKGNRSNEFPK